MLSPKILNSNKYVNVKAINGVRKTWHKATKVSHRRALNGFLRTLPAISPRQFNGLSIIAEI
jgi:hypothetical protein